MRRAILVSLLGMGVASAAPLKRVHVDEIAICMVRADATIACDDPAPLQKLVLPARDFVDSFSPLIVRPDGSVVRVERLFVDDPPKVVPIAVPFKVRQIALAGTDNLCVVGEREQLACGHFDPSHDLKLDARAVDRTFVEIQPSYSDLWALDDRGGLWCTGNEMCARFRRAGKLVGATWSYKLDEKFTTVPLARVADGVKHIYTTGGLTCFELADGLVCATSTTPPYPVAKPVADELVTYANSLCSRTGDRITCVNARHPPRTLSVHGAAKLHVGAKLCIESTDGALACTNPDLDPPVPVAWAKLAP